MTTTSPFAIEIDLKDETYDVGRKAAEAIYDIIVLQNPLRSHHDFVKCVAGFAIETTITLGRDYLRTYPDGDRTGFQVHVLNQIAGSLQAVARGFNEEAPKTAGNAH